LKRHEKETERYKEKTKCRNNDGRSMSPGKSERIKTIPKEPEIKVKVEDSEKINVATQLATGNARKAAYQFTPS